MGLQPVNYMTNTGAIRWVLVVSEIWRSAGWDSLLYLAAIIAIDPSLYEAAESGRGQSLAEDLVRHPARHRAHHRDALHPQHGHVPERRARPGVQHDQNDVNRSTIDIIDTYVYRIGLQTGEYALATAAGLFKGVIGFVLIIVAHTVVASA